MFNGILYTPPQSISAKSLAKSLNHGFAVPVRKRLHSHECFFLKLVCGTWFAKVSFLSCYILFENLQYIKYTSMNISGPF